MSFPIGLCTAQHVAVPLKSTVVEGRIRDLFADITLTQTWQNEESVPIEAVYTFPLPVDAILLDVQVTLGARRLRGSVIPKRQAEIDYEHAVADGDAAIRLEKLEDGLYAMNVSNLLPGEPAVVAIRWAQLLRWNGDTVRFQLPTTVAPRYGAPRMAPHQVPQASLAADHRCRVVLSLEGVLARGIASSPTHAIRIEPHGSTATRVRFADTDAAMDRDFVLETRVSGGERSSAVVVQDLEGGSVALLSWRPNFPSPAPLAPRALTIVVDCSGSMAGDSVVQAAAAIRQIVRHLRPQDTFEIVRFGSHAAPLFGRMQHADVVAVRHAERLVDALAADLGGTELRAALRVAYQTRHVPSVAAPDVLLITDGQITDHADVIRDAQASGQRVFTVGVGTAVTETSVREIARVTGGACELVTPNEAMTERIVRHFERMYASPAAEIAITWPGGQTLRRIPDHLEDVFDGDTTHAFAWLPAGAHGDLRIDLRQGDGTRFTECLPVVRLDGAARREAHPVARVAAYAWARSDAAQAESIALRYQLVTEQTDLLVVHERAEDEKATELPTLRTVEHMLAAGWGGAGSVAEGIAFEPLCEMAASPQVRRLSLDLGAEMRDSAPVHRKAIEHADVTAHWMADAAPHHRPVTGSRASHSATSTRWLDALLARGDAVSDFDAVLSWLRVDGGLAPELLDAMAAAWRALRDAGIDADLAAWLVVRQATRSVPTDRESLHRLREVLRRLGVTPEHRRMARLAFSERALSNTEQEV